MHVSPAVINVNKPLQLSHLRLLCKHHAVQQCMFTAVCCLLPVIHTAMSVAYVEGTMLN